MLPFNSTVASREGNTGLLWKVPRNEDFCTPFNGGMRERDVNMTIQC